MKHLLWYVLKGAALRVRVNGGENTRNQHDDSKVTLILDIGHSHNYVSTANIDVAFKILDSEHSHRFLQWMSTLCEHLRNTPAVTNDNKHSVSAVRICLYSLSIHGGRHGLPCPCWTPLWRCLKVIMLWWLDPQTSDLFYFIASHVICITVYSDVSPMSTYLTDKIRNQPLLTFSPRQWSLSGNRTHQYLW